MSERNYLVFVFSLLLPFQRQYIYTFTDTLFIILFHKGKYNKHPPECNNHKCY